MVFSCFANFFLSLDDSDKIKAHIFHHNELRFCYVLRPIDNLTNQPVLLCSDLLFNNV